VSKRETVPGFHGVQRDLDHSAHIRVPIRICLGTKSFSQVSVKRNMQEIEGNSPIAIAAKDR
jgi:hypothetical protein